MDKKNGSFLARFRGWFQAGATLLTNIHLPNFAKGVLYQGKGKTVCVDRERAFEDRNGSV